MLPADGAVIASKRNIGTKFGGFGYAILQKVLYLCSR